MTVITMHSALSDMILMDGLHNYGVRRGLLMAELRLHDPSDSRTTGSVQLGLEVTRKTSSRCPYPDLDERLLQYYFRKLATSE